MNNFYYDENGFLTMVNENGILKITPDDFYLTNKYRNTISIKGMENIISSNLPTYEELYEHWLKTKRLC